MGALHSSHQLPPLETVVGLKSNQNTSDEGSEATVGFCFASYAGVYALNAESSCREVLWDQRWMCAGRCRGQTTGQAAVRSAERTASGRRRGVGARWAVGLSLALGRQGVGDHAAARVSGGRPPEPERASAAAMAAAPRPWGSGPKASAPAWKCGLLPARWGCSGPSWGGWVLQGGSFLGLGVRRSGGRRSGWKGAR